MTASDALPSAIELLAPAGSRECARAAIENGADAVYFGLDEGFNARARAANMALPDLPDIMRELRLRGVRGYLTLNTLAFTSELPRVEQVLREVAAAGVDAILVQDLGVARLARRVCPDLELHASTQMTLTSAAGLRYAEQLGIARVVLPREHSIAEIRALRRQTSLPLEVFVHGALCVAYSGQCLTSESLGGRSANRGQCAQACRLPYELVCDGQDVDLGPVKYLLSPQDLAAHDLLPDLLEAGVTSFKIEGRLKTPEYVANITRHYRQALDAAAAGRPLRLTPEQQREMELSFSRGFSPGWLNGCDHKMLVPGLSSTKRGVLLGRVLATGGGRVTLALEAPLRAGDGVVFEGDRAAGEEQGGRVFAARDAGGPARRRGPGQPPAESDAIVEVEFARGAIDFARITPGLRVWKTDDPRLTQRLRKTFAGAEALRRVPLRLAIRAVVGEPLRVTAEADNGAACEAASATPLAAAVKHPCAEELLRAQFSRLGHTVYALAALEAHIEGGPMTPLSVLSEVRRDLLARLDAAAVAAPPRAIAAEPVLPALRAEIRQRQDDAAASAPAPGDRRGPGEASRWRLWVLCREPRQLEAALAVGARDLIVDYQDPRDCKEAVRAAAARDVPLWLATPRIEKPGELGVFHMLAKCQPAGLLVRNLGGARYCLDHGLPFAADFSLNAANELTVALLRELGAARVTASYDLNREQLTDLIEAAPGRELEVVIHQHMPMFHMEHCVFCAVLSPGTNKTNCGRPCDRHDVRLRDRQGLAHPLKADVGCRNTLFNAKPQSAAEAVPGLLARGVRHFRVELLDADAAATRRVIELYRDLLAGRRGGKEVWQALQAANRVGVTRGTLEEKRDPLALL